MNIINKKKLYIIFYNILILVLISSCSKPEQDFIEDETSKPDEVYISLSTSSINADSDGGDFDVEVESNVNYEVVISESSKEWIHEENKQENKHTFFIDKSLEYDNREGLIIFKSKELSDTIKVNQEGSSILSLNEKEYQISEDGGEISVDLKCNFDFGVKMPEVEWISKIETRALSNHTILFSIAPNETFEDRMAEVIFYDKTNNNITDTIFITQRSEARLNISMSNPGSLQGELNKLNINHLKIKKLFIEGPINGSDIRIIREMAGVDYIEKETDGILLKETGMTLASLETNRVALETVSDPQPYKAVMAEIIEIVRNKDYAAAREFFTESGYAMFDTLIRNGNVTLLEPIDSLRLVKYGETVICRKLPMQFKFRNNRQFVNDVVFRFNAETKKIESLAFALTRRSENDILTADKKWKEDWRMDLICFLEDYQTAYALKRIDYLESIFSDDALIVTGTVLKHKANSAGAGSDLPGASFEEVRYTKYTKDEFIRKLHYSFDSKEYINLRFNDTEVVKGSGPRDGIFAMQISQDYYSNNYGDTGYLTLLVDLREELPVIKVRVWQQRKDPEFTARALLNR